MPCLSIPIQQGNGAEIRSDLRQALASRPHHESEPRCRHPHNLDATTLVDCYLANSTSRATFSSTCRGRFGFYSFSATPLFICCKTSFSKSYFSLKMCIKYVQWPFFELCQFGALGDIRGCFDDSCRRRSCSARKFVQYSLENFRNLPAHFIHAPLRKYSAWQQQARPLISPSNLDIHLI